jgi:predicted nucleotidyltransferase component of viral defense system
MQDSPYFVQVRLLVTVLPVVARERCFALKGGTAINLFVRDMPRLSVDIDLAFVPIGDRAAALAEIDAGLARISAALGGQPYGHRVRVSKRQDARAYGLLVGAGAAEIKIEVSPVLRGLVYPEETRRIVPRAETEFGFAEVPVVSFADLYAGKIVAALDRQHPRDLFDVKLLLAQEGIGDELFRAFMVY